MANYRISKTAKEDLRRIYNYGLHKFGRTQADKYFDSLFSHFELISQRPLSFASVDFIRKGYRRCPCGSDSIYYRIKNDTVEIMAIIGAQDFNLQSDL